MLTEVIYGKHIQGEVIDFTMLECGGCGIPFFVPTKWKNSKVNEHGAFSCPNGCSRVFIGKTEAEKLKDEMELLKKQSSQREEELQNKWLDTLGEKHKLEKQMKRVHKGVCPCCNRSFHNLQQHIQNEHPEILGTQQAASKNVENRKKQRRKEA
jgi:hypothetical protein